MEHYFSGYQENQIALVLKGCRELIPLENYRAVVEEFADMLKVNAPRFSVDKFLDRAGVLRPAGEGMVATVPPTVHQVWNGLRNG